MCVGSIPSSETINKDTMLTFEQFSLVNAIFSLEELPEELSKSFFEVYDRLEETFTFTEFLEEKARSTHNGIQPWDELKISSKDAEKYASGDKDTKERIDAELDASKAKYVEPIKNRFTQILKRSANVVPSAKVLVDVKSNKSIISKIIRKTPYGKMKDILRSAVIVQRQEDIPKVMDALRKNFSLYQLKTKEKKKDPLGYYGSYHYIVEFGGALIEVQLMTKRLWTYKELGHEVYNKWREEIAKNPNLLNDPHYMKSNDELRKDVALSKRIFSRGNGANVRI